MELQVKKDFVSGVNNLSHRGRALGREKLLSDLVGANGLA